MGRRKEVIMVKKLMFINTEIQVERPLPPLLDSDCRKLERFFEEGNQIGFSCLLEAVEATMHQYMIDFQMSGEQYQQITERYGMR